VGGEDGQLAFQGHANDFTDGRRKVELLQGTKKEGMMGDQHIHLVAASPLHDLEQGIKRYAHPFGAPPPVADLKPRIVPIFGKFGGAISFMISMISLTVAPVFCISADPSRKLHPLGSKKPSGLFRHGVL
jgi:hypothetical protein